MERWRKYVEVVDGSRKASVRLRVIESGVRIGTVKRKKRDSGGGQKRNGRPTEAKKLSA